MSENIESLAKQLNDSMQGVLKQINQLNDSLQAFAKGVSEEMKPKQEGKSLEKEKQELSLVDSKNINKHTTSSGKVCWWHFIFDFFGHFNKLQGFFL